MAAFHIRSNSFASGANPFVSEIEEQLNRIKSSKAVSSSTEVYHKLSGLQDLHDCIDKLLTQKPFAKEQHKKGIDELLDGSLRLLDLCSVAKDALEQTRESVLELQSTIRRRTGCQETELKKYLASRKTEKKMIKKASENLKGKQKKIVTSLSIDNQEASNPFAILREVETTTLSIFESLFSLILGSKAQTKQSGWSLVSKMMQHKKVACDKEETESEFERVDAALCKTNKSENMHEKLKDLEGCVQDFEDKLENMSRRLIKTRVSLLNILNN